MIGVKMSYLNSLPSEYESVFSKLQLEGKCGELQNNGARCQSPILEWMPLDPDKPGGDRIGACGTHVNAVFSRAKYDIEVRARRWEEGWVWNEFDRIVRGLKKIGLKVKVGGYGRDRHIQIQNPAEFLATLSALGVWEKLGFDIADQPYGPPEPDWEALRAEVSVPGGSGDE